MIYIILLKRENLEAFKHFALNEQIVELDSYTIGEVPVVRLFVYAKKFNIFSLKGELPFIAEHLLVPYHNQYCPECLKQDNKFTLLPSQNKSGYCTKHRERNPKRLEKKKSPKNREKQ